MRYISKVQGNGKVCELFYFDCWWEHIINSSLFELIRPEFSWTYLIRYRSSLSREREMCELIKCRHKITISIYRYLISLKFNPFYVFEIYTGISMPVNKRGQIQIDLVVYRYYSFGLPRNVYWFRNPLKLYLLVIPVPKRKIHNDISF